MGVGDVIDIVTSQVRCFPRSIPGRRCGPPAVQRAHWRCAMRRPGPALEGACGRCSLIGNGGRGGIRPRDPGEGLLQGGVGRQPVAAACVCVCVRACVLAFVCIAPSCVPIHKQWRVGCFDRRGRRGWYGDVRAGRPQAAVRTAVRAAVRTAVQTAPGEDTCPPPEHEHLSSPPLAVRTAPEEGRR
jgi:hypothetical protein